MLYRFSLVRNQIIGGIYVYLVLHIYVYLWTLEAAQIPCAFKSVFLISFALYKGLMFVCHQLVLPLLILGKLEEARIPYAFNSVFHFFIRVLV